MQRCVSRDRQPEVQAEVDDDTDRAHQRGAEVAELVLRPLELAELVHQLLGVQRPTLAVARTPREQAVRAREPVGQADLDADLQVVSGEALVVRGRHLVEERDLHRVTERPPDRARAGEVLARAVVPGGERRSGRDGVDRHRPDLLGHLEVDVGELRERDLLALLHRVAERGLRLRGVGRVGAQQLEHPVEVGRRIDAARDLVRALTQHGDALPAPRVGRLEVEVGAEEAAGVAPVALDADAVLDRRVGQVDLLEAPCRLEAGGAHRVACSVAASGEVRVRRGDLVDLLLVGARRFDALAQLLGERLDLTARDTVALAPALVDA